MEIILLRPKLKTGGKQTAGPSLKDMVCGSCYRFFQLSESSWAACERKPCPHCGSRQTTPMLCEFENAEPVFVKGDDGGYI